MHRLQTLTVSVLVNDTHDTHDTHDTRVGAAGRDDWPGLQSDQSLVPEPALQGTQEGQGCCPYQLQGQYQFNHPFLTPGQIRINRYLHIKNLLQNILIAFSSFPSLHTNPVVEVNHCKKKHFSLDYTKIHLA